MIWTSDMVVAEAPAAWDEDQVLMLCREDKVWAVKQRDEELPTLVLYNAGIFSVEIL